MAKRKHLWAKSAPLEKPHAIYRAGDWEWRVLKAWQVDDSKPYARWFCAVKSPMTYGSYDMGDTYVADVVRYASLVHETPRFAEVA